MIYLVYNNPFNTEMMTGFLTESKFKYTILTWDKLETINAGFFIIIEDTLENGQINQLKKLSENRVQILLLNDFGNAELQNIKNLLILPANTDIFILRPLIYWMLFNNSSEECFKMLKSFFFENKFQIFFIAKNETILFSLPEDNSFLGYRGRYFQFKSFKSLFGVPTSAVPYIENQKDQNLYNLSTSKQQFRINLFKLAYDKIRIPGAPRGTDTIIFMLDAKTGASDDADPRFSLTEKQESSIQLKQKAIELLVSNEIHHRQAQKLRNAFEQLNNRNKQILEELSLASDLQKSLLPRKFPMDIPLNFTHKYLPYTYIGGDFFDVIRIDRNKIGIIIADASGHGVSAAFITAMFKSAFNHYKELHFSPSSLMSALNKEFYETIHTEHYITAFYAVLDIDVMKCIYCSAGHPKQLLIRKEGDSIELTTDGFFIGMFDETEYTQQEMLLYPGDRLIFFTDGILEITNSRQELFGRANIQKTIMENKHLDIESLSNTLMSTLVMYMEDVSFNDDITILITEVIDTL